jgi:hypothetical protein
VVRQAGDCDVGGDPPSTLNAIGGFALRLHITRSATNWAWRKAMGMNPRLATNTVTSLAGASGSLHNGITNILPRPQAAESKFAEQNSSVRSYYK